MLLHLVARRPVLEHRSEQSVMFSHMLVDRYPRPMDMRHLVQKGKCTSWWNPGLSEQAQNRAGEETGMGPGFGGPLSIYRSILRKNGREEASGLPFHLISHENMERKLSSKSRIRD
jgi:hypothetical protein